MVRSTHQVMEQATKGTTELSEFEELLERPFQPSEKSEFERLLQLPYSPSERLETAEEFQQRVIAFYDRVKYIEEVKAHIGYMENDYKTLLWIEPLIAKHKVKGFTSICICLSTECRCGPFIGIPSHL